MPLGDVLGQKKMQTLVNISTIYSVWENGWKDFLSWDYINIHLWVWKWIFKMSFFRSQGENSMTLKAYNQCSLRSWSFIISYKLKWLTDQCHMSHSGNPIYKLQSLRGTCLFPTFMPVKRLDWWWGNYARCRINVLRGYIMTNRNIFKWLDGPISYKVTSTL